MKLLVLLPVLRNRAIEEGTRKEISLLGQPDLKYEIRSLTTGPASIESEFDDRIASPWVLEEVLRAEREGFEAVFISCMRDVAISAAREIVRIPVVGPSQTCMAVASTLGSKFGVVTVVKNTVPFFIRTAREHGMERNLAGVRPINIPVLDLDRDRDREKLITALARESKKLVEDYNADSIILGCTGLVGTARDVQQRVGVPILDPTPISVKFAELLVATRTIHSAQTFPRPPEKFRKLPEGLDLDYSKTAWLKA
jgi:allantoin racemase